MSENQTTDDSAAAAASTAAADTVAEGPAEAGDDKKNEEKKHLLTSDPPKFTVGQDIRARWKGRGKWYDAKIESIEPDGYNLLYCDGDKAKVAEPHIRTLDQGTAAFLKDEKVKAQWKGRGTWYKATIVEVNKDGTFKVLYDDGDKDDAVNERNIIDKDAPEPNRWGRPQRPLMNVEEYHAKEEAMSLEERRARYKCGTHFVEAKDIERWPTYGQNYDCKYKLAFPVNDKVNEKIALWQGNICNLELDAIQNAANQRCLGGGGIDGAIHSAAGEWLYEECRTLNGCPTGQTKLTRGYNLPAKFCFHTVGPMGEDADALKSAYWTTLELVKNTEGVRTIAMCGVSTGVFGYPLHKACQVALRTTREWLETGDNASHVDLIVFCNYTNKERAMYDQATPIFFPLAKHAEQSDGKSG